MHAIPLIPMFENSQNKPSLLSRLFRSRRFQVISALSLVCLVGLVAIGAFLATPYFALWRMRAAAVNRDAPAFCSYIDFPVLRENLKAELNAKMLFDIGKDKDLKDNPFSGLAALAGPAVINNMVDGYVTPAAVDRTFREGALKDKEKNIATSTFNKDFLNTDFGEVQSGYKDLNEFQILYKPKDEKASLFIFERRALLTWQLVSIKFE